MSVHPENPEQFGPALEQLAPLLEAGALSYHAPTDTLCLRITEGARVRQISWQLLEG
jgi:hypothetical protein